MSSAIIRSRACSAFPPRRFRSASGKELFGWTDRQGTRWKVGWLPLGGYVKFVGDMTPASDPADLEDVPEHLRDRTFQVRPVWQRFLVVLAGPAANFLLAILIFAAFFAACRDSPRPTIALCRSKPAVAAAAAGIKPGDRILADRAAGARRVSRISPIVVILGAGERTVAVESSAAAKCCSSRSSSQSDAA